MMGCQSQLSPLCSLFFVHVCSWRICQLHISLCSGGIMTDFLYRFRGKWVPAVVFTVGSILFAIITGAV